ncbi:hypothetical protein GCM10022224_055850 [Nonomuraea antimicrobica]|uniref:Uncharacterized protein n=1 Tax=Nonomuraea antimicrobica TaxID=561173 RepID=A0ABP7CC15_9ACTN
MPVRVGFLVRELVDQVGESLPVLPWEAPQERDHRLEHLHGGLGRDGVVVAEVQPAAGSTTRAIAVTCTCCQCTYDEDEGGLTHFADMAEAEKALANFWSFAGGQAERGDHG